MDGQKATPWHVLLSSTALGGALLMPERLGRASEQAATRWLVWQRQGQEKGLSPDRKAMSAGTLGLEKQSNCCLEGNS